MYISPLVTAFRACRPGLPGALRAFSQRPPGQPGAAPRKFLKDDEIEAEKVRVLKDRSLLGDFTLFEARELARSQNLNLILFKPSADPPLCVLGKYAEFVRSLDDREPKKEPPSYAFDPALKSKTVQISENCATADLNRKLASIRKFILSGHRIDVVLTSKSKKGSAKRPAHPGPDDSDPGSASSEAGPAKDPSHIEGSLLAKIDYIYSRLSDIAKPHTLKNKVNVNSRQVVLKFWPK